MAFQVTALAHPEFGAKLQCLTCATRFYDMQKSPAHCPKCDSIVKPVVRVFSSRRVVDHKPKFQFSAPKPVADDEGAIETVEDDAAEDDDEDADVDAVDVDVEEADESAGDGTPLS